MFFDYRFVKIHASSLKWIKMKLLRFYFISQVHDYDTR